VRETLEQTRRVLLHDGGDLEFVALEDNVLKVWPKGNCVGCPRSVLDLKQVVERAVRQRFPQMMGVKNIF
jgi:toxin CptA